MFEGEPAEDESFAVVVVSLVALLQVAAEAVEPVVPWTLPSALPSALPSTFPSTLPSTSVVVETVGTERLEAVASIATWLEVVVVAVVESMARLEV